VHVHSVIHYCGPLRICRSVVSNTDLIVSNVLDVNFVEKLVNLLSIRGFGLTGESVYIPVYFVFLPSEYFVPELQLRPHYSAEH